MNRRAAPPGHRGPGGFTLVELLVVMGVIAILLTLLVPTLTGVRDQANVVRAESIIHGVSMALDAYKTVHYMYPPDKGTGTSLDLDKSSECLVYYLSGGSIAYDPDNPPENYRWAHPLFEDDSAEGNVRRAWTIYYEFKDGMLADDDNDTIPELIDPWLTRFIYNSGPRSSDFDQYDAPKHGIRRFDVFSAGRDKSFGTKDDVNSWDDSKGYQYTSYNLNSGDH